MGSAAKTCCSMGFGHAPVAMSRFVRRPQKVHRVAVTLVDEFRTSKVCHARLQAQLYDLKLRDPETGRREAHWQLKACLLCRNPRNSGPRAWQRDFNGAANIHSYFLAEDCGPKPCGAARRSCLLSRTISTLVRGAGTHALAATSSVRRGVRRSHPFRMSLLRAVWNYRTACK
jgi:hypothetical protein